jgi:hypothetical protein
MVEQTADWKAKVYTHAPRSESGLVEMRLDRSGATPAAEVTSFLYGNEPLAATCPSRPEAHLLSPSFTSSRDTVGRNAIDQDGSQNLDDQDQDQSYRCQNQSDNHCQDGQTNHSPDQPHDETHNANHDGDDQTYHACDQANNHFNQPHDIAPPLFLASSSNTQYEKTPPGLQPEVVIKRSKTISRATA